MFLPALRAQAQSTTKPLIETQPFSALSPPASSRARSQGANGLDTVAVSGFFARSSHVQWWVLGSSAVMFGTCGFLLRRRQRGSDTAMAKAVQKTEQRGETAESLVEALQGELLQLEVDRSLGTIAGEEYASAKQAQEGTVQRALERARSR